MNTSAGATPMATSTRSIDDTTKSTTATRATEPTTPMSNSNSTHNPCMPCIQLLHDAFARNDSRPMKLLQRMMMMDHNIVDRSGIKESQARNNHSYHGKPKRSSTRKMTPFLATSHRLSDDDNDQSLNVAWRKTNDGVQVQIPVKTTTTATIHTSDGMDYAPSIPIETKAQLNEKGEPPSTTSILSSLRRMLSLSLSSSPEQRHQEKDWQQQEDYHPHHQYDTEWLSVDCKMCNDYGPEANARAFVMGPTPLSIVICQNRLRETKPLSLLAKYFTSNIDNNSNNNQNSEDTTTTTSAFRHSRHIDDHKKHSTGRQDQNHTSSYNNNHPNHSAAHGSSNTSAQRDEVDEILTHELIHIYDIRQLQLDLRDCQNLAYSEVRAAREAECSKYHSLYEQHYQSYRSNNDNDDDNSSVASSASSTWSSSLSSFFPTHSSDNDMFHHHSLDHESSAIGMRCVRKKALMATNNLFPVTGKSCIDTIFHRAYHDIRPHRRTNVVSEDHATTINNPLTNTTTNTMPISER